MSSEKRKRKISTVLVFEGLCFNLCSCVLTSHVTVTCKHGARRAQIRTLLLGHGTRLARSCTCRDVVHFPYCRAAAVLDMWACTSCTVQQPVTDSHCFLCGTAQPAALKSASMQSGRSKRMRPASAKLMQHLAGVLDPSDDCDKPRKSKKSAPKPMDAHEPRHEQQRGVSRAMERVHKVPWQPAPKLARAKPAPPIEPPAAAPDRKSAV